MARCSTPEILAEVYLELTGMRQAKLSLLDERQVAAQVAIDAMIVRVRPVPLTVRVSDEERAAHQAFVATLGEKAIWKDYLPVAAAAE